MFLTADNHFTVRGRLVRNPEVNFSQTTGNAVTSITLAIETPFVNESGERSVSYIDYVAIDTKNNQVATRLAEFTVKGSPVSIEGYFSSYSKEINGEKKYYQTLRISSFRVEESKEETEKRRSGNK